MAWIFDGGSIHPLLGWYYRWKRKRRAARRAEAAAALVAMDTQPAVTTPKGASVSLAALAEIAQMGLKPRDAWQRPAPPPWLEQVMSGDTMLAMDAACQWDQMQEYALNSSPWSEGLGFLGYAYLAELTQRPEFRRISEIWAAECTRKWIKITGGDPKRVEKLEQLMVSFGVREKFREAIEIDGFFGRGHIFLDFGENEADLNLPLKHLPETITKGSLKNLKVIEAFWVYPLNYGTTKPTRDDFYAPQTWQVYGDRIDNSRLLTFVGREMPDILKPVYMFGGLSLSQMVKPYVDNYIRNRTSIGNLLFSFSTMVLSTNMALMLTDTGAQELMKRVSAYVFGRDNGGLQIIDKETEELTNVSAPLGTTDALLAQSLEQILIPAGIPMVIYAGTTPHGLNASSDGEIRAFYGHIMGYNEKVCTGPLRTLLRVLQLHMDGEIDEGIDFEWIKLWQPTEQEEAEEEAKQVESDCALIDRGVLSADDVRNRLKSDKESPYFGIEIEGDDEATPGAQAAALEEKDEGMADFDERRSASANDATPERPGAGVACFTEDGRVLLVRRSPKLERAPGKWAFPGGGVEDGESTAEAAWREFHEETGIQLPELTEVMHETPEFTTYRHVASAPFTPMLNPEHTAHMWTAPSTLPRNMHPGARAAIKTHLARAILEK